MVTIATWNVNSVRARLPHVLSYLKETSPDILLLQELKCQTEAFPYMEIEDLGYNCAVHGQKTYNGVAILSKYPIDDVIKTLPGDSSDFEARYIEAVISLENTALRVASIYVPNGQSAGSEKFAYKMRFFDRLYAHVNELMDYKEFLVLGGDYNVAPEAIDVYDPKSLEGSICFHPEERAQLQKLTYLGLTDAFRATHPDTHQYSWWDYRGGGWQQNKGMRIDHLLLSPEAADILTTTNVDTTTRNKEKASDHAAVECMLAF